MRLAGREDVARDVGVHHAVGERVADAGRRLGMRVDHAPAPVGSARDVGGEELDEPARRPQAMAGPQKGRIAEHELMGNGARRQQVLRPVEVGEDGFEQLRALDQRALQAAATPRRR